MSEIQRVGVSAAKQLLDDEGYTYVDVRTEEEFEAGHVPEALNVPISTMGPSGMVPNPDFVRVMEALFEKDAKILLGCRSGARSLRGAKMLAEAGFSNLVDLRPGWEGTRDPFGRLEPGWSKENLPGETGRPDGRKYEDLLGRASGGAK